MTNVFTILISPILRNYLQDQIYTSKSKPVRKTGGSRVKPQEWNVGMNIPEQSRVYGSRVAGNEKKKLLTVELAQKPRVLTHG